MNLPSSRRDHRPRVGRLAHRTVPLLAAAGFLLLGAPPARAQKAFVYVTEARQGGVAAYRITDGCIERTPFQRISTGSNSNPRRIVAQPDGRAIYVSTKRRIEAFKVKKNGRLKRFPKDLARDQLSRMRAGKKGNYLFLALHPNELDLYVAAAALDQIQHFRLNPNGSLRPAPTGSKKNTPLQPSCVQGTSNRWDGLAVSDDWLYASAPFDPEAFQAIERIDQFRLPSVCFDDAARETQKYCLLNECPDAGPDCTCRANSECDPLASDDTGRVARCVSRPCTADTDCPAATDRCVGVTVDEDGTTPGECVLTCATSPDCPGNVTCNPQNVCDYHCDSDSDCLSKKETCTGNLCVSTCEKKSDCPSDDYVCTAGTCVLACTDGACPGNECQGGLCVEIGTSDDLANQRYCESVPPANTDIESVFFTRTTTCPNADGACRCESDGDCGALRCAVRECAGDGDCPGDNDACPGVRILTSEALVPDDDLASVTCPFGRRRTDLPRMAARHSTTGALVRPKSLLHLEVGAAAVGAGKDDRLYVTDDIFGPGIIYVCRIDENGLLPECPGNTIADSDFEQSSRYERIALAAFEKDGEESKILLFASLFDDGATRAFNGRNMTSLAVEPREVFGTPVGIAIHERSNAQRVLYVTQGSLDRVDAYEFDETGFVDTKPLCTTAQKAGSFPNDVVVVTLP
jgi:hypothetical protein